MMTVAQALSAIISRFGIEILNFPDQVQSMVMDFAGSSRRDTRLFCVACRKGILSIAQEMYSSNDTNQAIILAERAKSMLMQDFFLAEENAVLCVNMLLEGVGNELRLALNHIEEKYRATNFNFGMQNGNVFLNEDKLHTSICFGKDLSSDTFHKLQQAGEEGNIHALIQLGECFQRGYMVHPNWRMAEFYYKKAIKVGELRDDFEAILLVKEAKNKLYMMYNEYQR